MYLEFDNLAIGLWPIAILVFAVAAWRQWRKTRNVPYLFCLAVFSIYLIKLVDVVLFPIPLYGQYAAEMRRETPLFIRMNLIPLYFGEFGLSPNHFRSLIENILLTIPFGFGILFIARINKKFLYWLPLAVGLGTEGSQLIISEVVGYAYRVIDVNDIIFNALGVAMGLLGFWCFSRIILRICRVRDRSPKTLLGYLLDVAQRV